MLDRRSRSEIDNDSTARPRTRVDPNCQIMHVTLSVFPLVSRTSCSSSLDDVGGIDAIQVSGTRLDRDLARVDE
jgi:hypothetical protein